MRWTILDHVRSLDLPDCWVAAGFVRNLAWSRLHGRETDILTGDVDVIWFDPARASETFDRTTESQLRQRDDAVKWSVKNQARMHLRNGDGPYSSSEDAMHYWPETATAVAVRRTKDDVCEIITPLGLEDLMTLRLRPAGAFNDRKRNIFDQRVTAKQWLVDFPQLQLTA
ncbi:MAG: nucleotidyltransferase family protein [Novosphingobium sp.]|nr:nucleotidyltransferase family protein [Novosphingobium sp.]